MRILIDDLEFYHFPIEIEVFNMANCYINYTL